MLKKAGHWVILFVTTDFIFIFLTWVLNPRYMGHTSLFIILFTLFAVGIGCFLDHKKKRKLFQAIRKFLENPGEENMDGILPLVSEDWYPVIRGYWEELEKQTRAVNREQLELQNYREYIEAWAHEIKTPLSLAKMMIHHREEEMTPYVYSRMNYVSHKIGEDVERILYYARLEADHVDYRFTKLQLDDCAQEVLSEYQPFASEKKIHFRLLLTPEVVISDQRLVHFILSQLIGNAVKYVPWEGIITIAIWKDRADGAVHLAVRDNGEGVPPQDAPFLFDKGFTGSFPGRQKATGMGLYLVKKYAKELTVDVRLEETEVCGTGFGIELIFPHV